MRSFFRWVHSLRYVVQGARALRQGDDAGVIRHYSRAIEISPEDLDYYHARARAYGRRRELGLAVVDFTKAIELKEDDYHAYYMRGVMQRERGFLAQAIGDFSQVIELCDGMLPAHLARASCYMEKEDFARAKADVEEALKVDPRHETARAMMAWCRQRLENGDCEKDEEKSGDAPRVKLS